MAALAFQWGLTVATMPGGFRVLLRGQPHQCVVGSPSSCSDPAAAGTLALLIRQTHLINPCVIRRITDIDSAPLVNPVTPARGHVCLDTLWEALALSSPACSPHHQALLSQLALLPTWGLPTFWSAVTSASVPMGAGLQCGTQEPL